MNQYYTEKTKKKKLAYDACVRMQAKVEVKNNNAIRETN